MECSIQRGDSRVEWKFHLSPNALLGIQSFAGDRYRRQQEILSEGRIFAPQKVTRREFSVFNDI